MNARGWKNLGAVKDEDADAHVIAAAGAIEADASVISIYKKTRPKVADNVRYFKICRNRFEEQSNYPEPRYVEQVEGGALRVMPPLQKAMLQVAANDERIIKALEVSDGSLPYKDLEEASLVSARDRALKPAVEDLIKQERLYTTGKPRSRTDPYTVHLSPATETEKPAPEKAEEPKPKPKPKRRRVKALNVPDNF